MEVSQALRADMQDSFESIIGKWQIPATILVVYTSVSHRSGGIDTAMQYLNSGNSSGVAEVFNSIDWTPEKASELQNDIEFSDITYGYCWYDETHQVSGTLLT